MTKERARELRKNQTDAQRFVWKQLRDRRLSNFKFRRQVQIGSYYVDFVCFEKRLIVELDGGQHADEQVYDEERTRWLVEQGFSVQRFWNHEALRDWEMIEEFLWRLLTEHSSPPSRPHHLPGSLPQRQKGEKHPSPPAPLPQGERRE